MRHASRPLFLPFHNRDVAINRQISKPLHSLRSGCGHFTSSQSIFVRLPNAQHHARIVRRKIAASADFHVAALQIAGLIRDPRANRIGIRLLPHQLHSQPVVLLPGLVAQQQRRRIVDRDQHIHRAVIIEISNGQPRAESGVRKYRPTLCADILKPLARIVQKDGRLAICTPG